MVEYHPAELDATFHALANPVRRQIVAHLAQTPSATVLEIAALFEISLNGVSKHLKVLEQGGLITRNIQGRTHHCALRPEPLQSAQEWITYHRQFWQERLDGLETYLESQRQAKK